MTRSSYRCGVSLEFFSTTFGIALVAWCCGHPVQAEPLNWTLQSRDPATGEISTQKLAVEPKNVAVVLVDTWNFHWCLTATERCGSFAARFNQAVPELRNMGMLVCWCPTDVADQYAGTPMRQIPLALPRKPLPPSRNIEFSPIDCFQSNHCMCGPGIKCPPHFGWDAMAPSLKPADGDLMPEGTEEFYNVCVDRGITHLVYFGFHTNVCTTGKPVGIRPMANAGLQCILARDMTDAITGYDPATNHHPDTNTEDVIAIIERQVPTVHIAEELGKLGRWTDKPVDPVRIIPAGTVDRPHVFEDSILVSLTSPLTPGVRIHYTLDGSEPGPASPLYQEPLKISETTTLRAIGIGADGKPRTLPNAGYWAKLSPMPPTPTVNLADLKPRYASCSGFHHFGSNKRPRTNTSYTGGPIICRDRKYEKGIGVAAPAQMIYDIKPDYRRFVARVGIDETMQSDDAARAVGMYPSVVAEIWIDGKRIAQSPMLRYRAEPWRFDIAIPEGSRQISCIVTDGGNGNRYDLANWFDAGFAQ